MTMVPSDKQIETITNLVSQGVDHGATALNTILNSDIDVELPFVKLVDSTEMIRHSAIVREKLLSIVQMAFDGDLRGHCGIVFQKQNALRLVESLEGEERSGDEFDLVSTGVYTEIGNIVLNSVMGYISNALHLSLDYVVPYYSEGDLTGLVNQNESGLLARARFKVEHLATEGDIILFFEPKSYAMLLSSAERLG
jgi:chemotaxis protein CheC